MKQVLITILLWISMLVISIINKKIITYSNLKDLPSIILSWLSIGPIILMFFLSFFKIFNDKSKKLFTFFRIALIVLWFGGLIFIALMWISRINK